MQAERHNQIRPEKAAGAEVIRKTIITLNQQHFNLRKPQNHLYISKTAITPPYPAVTMISTQHHQEASARTKEKQPSNREAVQKLLIIGDPYWT